MSLCDIKIEEKPQSTIIIIQNKGDSSRGLLGCDAV